MKTQELDPTVLKIKRDKATQLEMSADELPIVEEPRAFGGYGSLLVAARLYREAQDFEDSRRCESKASTIYAGKLSPPVYPLCSI